MSGVAPETLAAFLATHYRVRLPGGEATLRIGEVSTPLARMLAERGDHGAAYITAWNPGSRPAETEANLAAQRRLEADLAALGADCFPGAGTDPTGVWPPEPSVLAIGIRRQDAETLGRRYGQDAILWVTADGCPQLVLLGEKP